MCNEDIGSGAKYSTKTVAENSCGKNDHFGVPPALKIDGFSAGTPGVPRVYPGYCRAAPGRSLPTVPALRIDAFVKDCDYYSYYSYSYYHELLSR